MTLSTNQIERLREGLTELLDILTTGDAAEGKTGRVLTATVNLDTGEIVKEPEFHNPDNLTPEQVGVKDGWRLLVRDEFINADDNWWNRDYGWWQATVLGLGKPMHGTYRTKRPLPQQPTGKEGAPCAVTSEPLSTGASNSLAESPIPSAGDNSILWTPWGFSLWKHLRGEHGLTLTDSELYEIILKAKEIDGQPFGQHSDKSAGEAKE